MGYTALSLKYLDEFRTAESHHSAAFLKLILYYNLLLFLHHFPSGEIGDHKEGDDEKIQTFWHLRPWIFIAHFFTFFTSPTLYPVSSTSLHESGTSLSLEPTNPCKCRSVSPVTTAGTSHPHPRPLHLLSLLLFFRGGGLSHDNSDMTPGHSLYSTIVTRQSTECRCLSYWHVVQSRRDRQ